MTPRTDKTVFVAVVLIGAGLALGSASRAWVLADVPDLTAVPSLQVTGREVAGVVPAVALVGLAGVVAVLTTRRVGQVVTGALLAVAGAAAATVSAGVLRTPGPAVVAAVTTATGRTGVDGVSATVTGWPWLGLASGVLIALGGCLAVARARSWAGLPSRYDITTAEVPMSETPAATAPVAEVAEDPSLTWDRLTRGDDPTR